MKLELSLNDLASGPFYVGYSPVKCSVKNLDVQQGGSFIDLTLKNRDTTKGGQIVFYVNLDSAEADQLNIKVPNDGTETSFFIGGKYQRPSIEYGDAIVEGIVAGKSEFQSKLMVRVRKSANNLTNEERERFLKAFADFVESGNYKRFLDMHGEDADMEIHGRSSFLPWHRIFLLDLERNLQLIDGRVTIPYWDFQNPAPDVFTENFMGVPDMTNSGILKFRANHEFEDLRITGSKLARIPRFDTANDKANVEDFDSTTNRGPGFYEFCTMEGDPHGYAHTSFRRGFSPVAAPSTATQDPLFYMLHANIDRLWAEWQHKGINNVRFEGVQPEAYDPRAPDSVPARIGDFLNDEMWPWNGIRGTGDVSDANPRPNITAPGGELIPSPFTAHPGGKPTVLDTIDYQGRITKKSLSFDYDTVPYLNSADFQSGSESAGWAKVNSFHNLKKMELEFENFQNQNLTTFKLATDKRQVAESLSEIGMLEDERGTAKALSILKNESNDPGIRVLALTRLTRFIGKDTELIAYVLGLAADQNQAENLRKEALRTIEILEFSSAKVKALQPEIKEVLRNMINDNNLEMRKLAIGSLAQAKDDFIQHRLIQGIENPSTALVSEEEAVHLLGLDLKAAPFSLLRKVVTNSSNNNSRANALFILGNDPDSKDLLIEVFNNKKERFNVRKNSFLSLKQLDKSDFAGLARKTIVDHLENDDLRLLSIKNLRSTDLPEKDQFIGELKALKHNNLSEKLSIGIESFLNKK